MILIRQARRVEQRLRETTFSSDPRTFMEGAIIIAALITELEAEQLDAARYRWLRVSFRDDLVMHGDISNTSLMMGSELDEAIDGAIAAGGETK